MDPENAKPSIPNAFVPIISGREQWTHYDLKSGNIKIGDDATSGSFLAEISVRSSRKLFIFII